MHHNINMFTTGNTHLKYRKHRAHSSAHKLKIRSSRLVLTTGTDLDSTDRAAIGGAKNSSASEPLKRPILSLWNSRDKHDSKEMKDKHDVDTHIWQHRDKTQKRCRHTHIHMTPQWQTNIDTHIPMTAHTVIHTCTHIHTHTHTHTLTSAGMWYPPSTMSFLVMRLISFVMGSILK